MKKILFISHDANRAGAQILLLRFLKQLKTVPEYQFKVLLRHGGSLLRDFEKVAPVYHWYHRETGNRQKVARLLNRKSFQEQILKEIKNEGYDLIVSNTITNGELLHQLRPLVKCPIVTYAHEMPMGIAMYTDPSSFNQTLRYSDSYWACSEAQRLIYIERFGIDPGKISVLPSLLPDGAWQLQPSAEAVAQIRKLLDLPEGAPLVGAVGTFDWRKGIDIFVQLALQVKNAALNKPVSFYWFGANETIDLVRLQYEVKKMGLQNKVHFIPASNQVPYFFKAIDLFVLTSREDPYPLVVLEAADAAVPIICFEDAGGAPEFVAQDAGSTVPYLDMVAAASAIKSYILNPQLLAMQGSAAQKKVAGLHQDKQLIMQQFETISA